MVVAEVAVTVEVAVGAVEGKVVVAVVVAVAVAPGRAARVTCDLPMRIVLNESMSSDHAVHDADVHWTVAARGVRELRQNCAALRELRFTWTVAARGALCSKASSPKAMPFVAVITEPLPSTEMSHSPCRSRGEAA